MAQILDYSAGYPGGAAVQRAGYEGVIRYLRKEGTSRVRPITAAELADMQAHGRTVALVYQHVDKARPTQGRAAGRHDAEWALARAREIGIEPRAVYLAVDFDTTSVQQWAQVREYMLGAGEVLGVERVGTYGEYDLLDYLFVRGSITWGWQTYAWSTGHNKDNQPRHPRAHLFQRLGLVTIGGVQCDVNDVLKTDYGQIPAPQEDDMTPEQAQMLADIHAVTRPLAVEVGPKDPDTGLAPTKPLGLNYGIANLFAMVFYGSNYGWGPSILDRLAEIAGQEPPVVDVDEAALAAELAPLLPSLIVRLPEDQIAALVEAIPEATRQKLATALAGGSNT